MPLPEGLLNPIPGKNPSGQDLRYDPVYDKIREARRADEEIVVSEELSASNAVWASAMKKADFPLVSKLAAETLLKRTKDLQIAAWLTEALLAQEKIAGLLQGLTLIRGLIENFWDTLYPLAEDDDLGIRSGPIEWVGSRLDYQIRQIPLTKDKLKMSDFRDSQSVPYEKEAKEDQAKKEVREAAIQIGKCTPERFNESVRISGEAHHAQLTKDISDTLEAIQALETLTEEKFGREAPSFVKMKKALEDLQDTVREYWKPAEEKPLEEEEEQLRGQLDEQVGAAPEASVSAAPVRKRGAVTEEPADAEDAVRRLIALASFLRKTNPASPISYMVLRDLRWGELRSNGSSIDAAALDSPPSETRQLLKKLAAEGQWGELLESAETAMAQSCGRGWLDLQRYTTRACESLGFEAAAAAVRGAVRSLLSDYPDLVSASLSDDTPAANNETQVWIGESILPPPPAPPEPNMTIAPSEMRATLDHNGSRAPDVLELAQQAARSGRIQEAVELLSREISQERSGRARFLRRVQLAELCLSARQETIAYPILTELAEEIERRKLDEWEEPSLLAQALLLLFSCMGKLGFDDAAKQKIYQKICRLDPVKVLSAAR